MLKLGSKHNRTPKIFEEQYYRRLYQLEERHWWCQGMRSILQRQLDRHVNGRYDLRILDVGCGTGGMLKWLDRYAPADQIVGIDVSRYALQICNQRQLRQVVQVSITQLPFPNGTFDLVTCLDVLQHLPRDGSDIEALRECCRVLKPGGLLYLRTNADPQPEHHSGNHEQAVSRIDNYHRYGRRELVEIVSGAGLAVTTATYANMVTALLKDSIKRLNPFRRSSASSTHYPYQGLAVRVPPAGLNAVMKLVLGWEAWYLSNGKRSLPYGHGIVCIATKPELDALQDRSMPQVQRKLA